MEAVGWDGRAIIMADEPPRLRGSSESTSEVERPSVIATFWCNYKVRRYGMYAVIHSQSLRRSSRCGMWIGWDPGSRTWRGVVSLSHVAWPIISLYMGRRSTYDMIVARPPRGAGRGEQRSSVKTSIIEIPTQLLF